MPEDPNEKITRARIKIMLRLPFFGFLALSLKPKADPAMTHSGTDGRHLFYDPAWLEHVDPALLESYIAHQTLNCAFGHLWRRGARDEKRWDIATDHVTNLMLKKEGFTIPLYAYCDHRFERMSVEEVYALLPAKEQEQDQNQNSSGNDQNSGKAGTKPTGSNDQDRDKKRSGRGLLDSHEKWDNPDSDSEGTDAQNAEGEKDSTEGSDAPAESEAQKLEREWKDRLLQATAAASMRGDLPSSIRDLIESELAPQLDWKTLLREFITVMARNDFRLIPPSKRYISQEIYLPSVTGEDLEIAIALDTSGSVSPAQFKEFIAELRAIAEEFENFHLHIFFCDAHIHDRMELSQFDEWPQRLPKAGGGTDFRPVFDTVMREHLPIAALIYLTDGDGSNYETAPPYPVLWVLNAKRTMPWGISIRMETARG